MRALPRWSGLLLAGALVALTGCRGCGCGGPEASKDAGKEAPAPVAAKKPAPKAVVEPPAPAPAEPGDEGLSEQVKKSHNPPLRPGTVGIPPVTNEELKDDSSFSNMPRQSKVAIKALQKVQAAHPELVPKPIPAAPAASSTPPPKSKEKRRIN